MKPSQTDTQCVTIDTGFKMEMQKKKKKITKESLREKPKTNLWNFPLNVLLMMQSLLFAAVQCLRHYLILGG